jgi:hypothetical protein
VSEVDEVCPKHFFKIAKVLPVAKVFPERVLYGLVVSEVY